MPGTAPTRLPTTPAEVAAAVLDGIETYPDAFDMENWAHMADAARLAPDQAPSCRTTLCAAGWAAHVTGWTLVDMPYDDDQHEEPVMLTDSEGFKSFHFISVYAEKGDVRRLISDVAREALGLTEAQAFWHATPEVALQRLREIAGR